MKTTRKRYSAEFKAKVAMEAIRGDLTLAELAAKHGVHHTMIGAWKRQAMDGMASLFDGGDQAAKASSEAEMALLQTLLRLPRLGPWIGKVGCDGRFQRSAFYRRGHPVGGTLVLPVRHQLP
jgi:transposase